MFKNELNPQDTITDIEKREVLELAINSIIRFKPFYGNFLVLLSVSYDSSIPTLCVTADAVKDTIKIKINPIFFIRKVKSTQSRAALLLHEISHVIHGHFLRHNFAGLTRQQAKISGIAADIAINQYIDHLPCGCDECNPDKIKFHNKLGGFECSSPLCPSFGYYPESIKIKEGGQYVCLKKEETYEYYFNKIKEAYEQEKRDPGSEGSISKEIAEAIDSEDDFHISFGDDGVDNLVGDIIESLIKRAIQKTSDQSEDGISSAKDLVNYISKKKKGLNYKKILLLAIKKSVSGVDRTHTWTRRNKRYGFQAPGTKMDELPLLSMFLDTSGSITQEEMSTFLGVVDGFLKVGARKCTINLFNTTNYHKQAYKAGDKKIFDYLSVGGTDLTDSLMVVAKENPNLSIFLTDGYYPMVDVKAFKKNGFPKVVFVISSDGSVDHPFANEPWATTIQMVK